MLAELERAAVDACLAGGSTASSATDRIGRKRLGELFASESRMCVESGDAWFVAAGKTPSPTA